MSKLILKRFSSRFVQSKILLCTKNLRKVSSSTPEHVPTTENKLEVEDVRKTKISYPPSKKPVMYPEPKIAVLPSEIKEQELLQLELDILSSPDYNTLFLTYLRERNSFELIHFCHSLKRLAELCNESTNSSVTIQENEAFQSLCYEIWKKLPQMDPSMALKIYKHLLNLNVRSDSLVIQSLLQMARHQINQYSFHDLLLLHVLLRKTDDCNLKIALQTALPKVLENSMNFHFPKHLRFGEMSQLLNICITGNVNKVNEVIQHIYETSLPKLIKEEENDDVIRKNLISLLQNLCLLDTKSHTQIYDLNVIVVGELIYYCLDELLEKNIYCINRNVLLPLLRSAGHFFARSGNYSVIHDTFLSIVSRRCFIEDWDVQSCFHVIDAQLKLNYVSDDLVSFAVSKLSDAVLEDLKDIHLPSILLALATSNLPKELSTNAANFLLKKFTLSFQHKNIPWVQLALGLLHLNYFDLSILKGIIDKNFLKRFLRDKSDIKSRYDYMDIRRLSKYMKCFKETSELNIYSKFLINPEEQLHSPGLRKLLTRIIGNEHFISSNIVTPQGNYIDHIVLLEGESLVNLENIKTSEIFNDKTGVKRIAIMEVPESQTVQPDFKVNISCKVDFHLIKKEGFVILPIFEREIIDYKEDAFDHIKSKLEKWGIYKAQ